MEDPNPFNCSIWDTCLKYAVNPCYEHWMKLRSRLRGVHCQLEAKFTLIYTKRRKHIIGVKNTVENGIWFYNVAWFILKKTKIKIGLKTKCSATWLCPQGMQHLCGNAAIMIINDVIAATLQWEIPNFYFLLKNYNSYHDEYLYYPHLDQSTHSKISNRSVHNFRRKSNIKK